MIDKDYMDADYEVISMVNRGRGTGGELPGKALTFIPSDRADRICALDARIQKLQKILPWVSGAALVFSGLLIGMNL